MLKGRQTGAMHRGHAWVFRAESHETMLAWYEDIKNLTEKTGEARNAFVRRHARSMSGASQKPGSISSDGAMDEDEADETPYAADRPVANNHGPPPIVETQWQRPQPGGRFPSDVQLNRHLHVPLSPSSGESSGDRDALAAAGALPGSGVPFTQPDHVNSDGGHYEWVSGGQSRSEFPPQQSKRHEIHHVEWTAPVTANSTLTRPQDGYDPYLPPQSQQSQQTCQPSDQPATHQPDSQPSPVLSRSGSAPIPVAPETATSPFATPSTNSTRRESNSTNHTNPSIADSGTGLNIITTDTSVKESNGEGVAKSTPASNTPNGSVPHQQGVKDTLPATAAVPIPSNQGYQSGTDLEPSTSASTVSELKLPGRFPG